MAENTFLNLEDYLDGVINSQPPGTPDSVTFLTTSPYQSINADGGFSIQFVGKQFTHSHPRVIAILRGLAKRNVGIFEVAAAEIEVAAKKVEEEAQADKQAGSSVPVSAQARLAAAALTANAARQ